MIRKCMILGASVALFGVTLWTSSCSHLSSENRTDGTVIERNKQTRPAWADSPTDQMLYTSSETRFHFAVLKARDLPIAVKQSQTEAIEASYNLWKPIFDQKVYEVAQIRQLRGSSKSNRELNDIVNRLAHRIHSEIAQIEDIYFERIKIDNYKSSTDAEAITEYYDVHTLVHLGVIDNERLNQSLASELQSSRITEISRAGKDLKRSLSKKTGPKKK